MTKQCSSNEPILVSACLLGEVCRWHGKQSYSKAAAKLAAGKKIIPICPEMLGGLPVPRPPVKRKNGRVHETCPEKALRREVTGIDVTEQFTTGAELALKIAKDNGAKQAILCKWSPSCDISGVTGKLLHKNGVEVINTW